ncbi:MAG: hypothetical protein IT580_16065 [Verrucomicrobiales bacterium]|nr:hypothetical protein [Verrucomicrobiales bacterium]
MKLWKAILAATLLFLCGAVTGALAYRGATAAAAARTQRDASLKDWIETRFGDPSRLQQELGLTTDQTRRVETILNEGRSRMREVWKSCQPQVREEVKRVRERIEAELSPDQKSRFEELMKRSRSRFKQAETKSPAPAPSQPAGAEKSHP